MCCQGCTALASLLVAAGLPASSGQRHRQRVRTCSAVAPSLPSIEMREVMAREKREPEEPRGLPTVAGRGMRRRVSSGSSPSPARRKQESKKEARSLGGEGTVGHAQAGNYHGVLAPKLQPRGQRGNSLAMTAGGSRSRRCRRSTQSMTLRHPDRSQSPYLRRKAGQGSAAAAACMCLQPILHCRCTELCHPSCPIPLQAIRPHTHHRPTHLLAIANIVSRAARAFRLSPNTRAPCGGCSTTANLARLATIVSTTSSTWQPQRARQGRGPGVRFFGLRLISEAANVRRCATHVRTQVLPTPASAAGWPAAFSGCSHPPAHLVVCRHARRQQQAVQRALHRPCL